MATRTITTKLAMDGEAEFKNAMTRINAEMRTMKSELSLLDAQFKGQANSLDYLTKKQDILEKQYVSQVETVAALEAALDDATEAYGAADTRTQKYQQQLNQARVQLINLNGALEENERYLREAERSADGTADSIDEFGREVEEADDALEDAGGAALSFGDILKANLASGAILGGLKKLGSYLVDFAKSSIDAGKAFDSAMSQVAATMGVSVKQVGELRDFAQEMGSTTAFSSTEAAQGLNILAMAGLTAKEQMAALPQVLNLAAAGTLSLDSAAAYVTGTIKGFKDEMSNAQYYTDLIAKGATLANTSVTGLGDALSRSAATADGYRQSADSVTLALLRLAEQNLEGEAASTALNRAMSDLYTPTAAAQKALDELGFSAYNEAEAARDFNEVVDELNLKLADMTDAQRSSYLATIFTTQGLNAFNKMVSTSPEKLEAFKDGLDGAFGSTAEQAETQLDNLAGDLTLFDSAVDGLKIRISDALSPALRTLVQGATAAVSALAGLGTGGEDLPLLVSGTNELLETLDQSAGAYTASAEAIQQQADSVLGLISTLEELDGMSLRTSSQQQAMLDIIDQLNAAIPGLNLAYDEQTQGLNMNAEAVRALAEAEAERQAQAEGIRRLNELDAEHEKIVQDLAAAEAQLAEAQEHRSSLTGIFSREIMEADKAITQAAGSVDRLESALLSNETAASYLEAQYGDVKDIVEEVSDTMEDGSQTAEDLAAAYEAAANETQALTDAAALLKSALDEQANSGELSLDTALKLIDAGYAAALSIDEETNAITLNKEAYVQLARAKLEEQITALSADRQAVIDSLHEEQGAVEALAAANYDLAISKYEVNQADVDQVASYDAQIAALKALQKSIGSYSGQVMSTARTASSVSRASSKTAEKVKTQAEQDLESYKAMTAELEHLRNMDAISERDYYDDLAQYRDQFLADDANVSEYRKVTEEIYEYDKSLGEQEAALWSEQTERLIDELKERYESILSEQNRMQENLAGYGDLFEAENDQMSLNSLQDQIDAINAYEEALTSLREKGISDSLLDEVLAMDVDSATQYAEQLLAMSNEQWEEYNELWEEKQQRAMEVAETFYKEELDALENEYNGKLGDVLMELQATAFDSGIDTVKGMIEGLQSQEGALYAQAEEMARQVSVILAAATSSMAADMNVSNLREPAPATARDVRNAASSAVNGMAIMPNTGSGDLTVPLYIDGKEIARATLPDFRAVSRANPEIKDDV